MKCTKIKHANRAAARRALKGFPMGSKERLRMQVYQCPDCHGWHFGHRVGTRTLMGNFRRRAS